MEYLKWKFKESTKNTGYRYCIENSLKSTGDTNCGTDQRSDALLPVLKNYRLYLNRRYSLLMALTNI